MGEVLTFVALDLNDQHENMKLAKKLSEQVDSPNFGFKINLDSLIDFNVGSPHPASYVRHIKLLNKPVFVDLKMWNGRRTMSNIARGLALLDVDIINMYVHAGEKFINGVKDVLKGSNTKLFGLTVLTHYDDSYTQDIYQRTVREAVKVMVGQCDAYGMDGVILPGTMLGVADDYDLLKLCPAIRPSWYGRQANDQKQVTTPTEAVNGGATHIVVGSPIIKADDVGITPCEALERILDEVKRV